MDPFFSSIRLLPLSISVAFMCISCNAQKFYNETYAEAPAFTLGNVQKEIRKGMSQDAVAIALGSPNIVTQDKAGKEAWIYDKIATQARSSGADGLLLFIQTGADYVHRRETSQQTLTVIIKFTDSKEVESVSYHSSKF